VSGESINTSAVKGAKAQPIPKCNLCSVKQTQVVQALNV